ncbi:RCC1 domain-containing protein [Hyalangium rubrum]|uniref:non-specific serine/threonine protein kinase n=1 Tax=Hyalangium rubrum TaxID=3103134 RepID=A0ABU5HBC4_9BACT|nr:hypothetical protein [Hyalangium sp. s54d21]MDY7230394.1 hypothetical protein [Hyalangium sp. s54d21]
MHFRREQSVVRPALTLVFAAAIAAVVSFPSEGHASSSTGQITHLCGSVPPLPYGYTGYSPTGPCEGVCYSGWTDGSCNDPVDSQSRVEVYGCTGKTSGSGYSCDGDHNGGVLLATLSAGEYVPFSWFTSDTNYCTFAMAVLRPNENDAVGLRDFIIWERDECSPPPPLCDCPGGTDYLGNPVSSTTCNEPVCGADYQWYSCQQGGWAFEGGVCYVPPVCSCTGTDYEDNTVTVACGNQVCGRDFQWYACENSNWTPQGGTCPEAPPASWLALSAGGYHTCGLRSDGNVSCWGSNTSGQAPSFVQGPFNQISAGYDFTCGLRTNGSIECWGSNEYGQAPSYRAGPYLSLSAGVTHTCGVTISLGIDCWGNMQGTPPTTGDYYRVAAGGYHTCALETDGTVACWGEDGWGQATPPSGNFMQISANYTTSCGVLIDDTAVCWGQDSSGQATPPSISFSQVSAGYIHTCGVDTSGQLACWGDSYQGVLNAPSGDYTQVTAGFHHNCALSTSGEPVCWGSNSSGQLNVPQ